MSAESRGGIYYCPTSGETEHPTRGGFEICCDRPDLHRFPGDVVPCTRCNGERWVCEDHTDRPWNYGSGCGAATECCWFVPFVGFAPGECQFIDGCHHGRPCEMAGMPCPSCNANFPGAAA